MVHSPKRKPNSDSRRTGIFFVTDLGFALPTVVSALQVRRKTPLACADIRILTLGIDSQKISRMRELLEPRGLHVDEMPVGLISGLNMSMYNQTHVPVSALGRFFILDCFPDVYDRIIYLDGDTWLLGNITELIDSDQSEGTLAAAEDPAFFYSKELGRTGRNIREYFRGIGLRPGTSYFNSGVLTADSSTWKQLCAEAFEFLRQNTARCAYHDQSALNAVIGDRREFLSPRWNFAHYYYDWGITGKTLPHIVHFCGGRKPWMQPSHRFHDVFMSAFDDVADLGLSVKLPNETDLAAMEAGVRRQLWKNKTVLLPRMINRQFMYSKLVNRSAIK